MDKPLSEDAIIGLNVARLRESSGLSMDMLAAKMRDEGNKWSRSTVFKIEHGERSLKYSESVDLFSCLGLDPTVDLFELSIIPEGQQIEESYSTTIEFFEYVFMAAEIAYRSRGILFDELKNCKDSDNESLNESKNLVSATVFDQFVKDLDTFLEKKVVPDYLITYGTELMSRSEAKDIVRKRFEGVKSIRELRLVEKESSGE